MNGMDLFFGTTICIVLIVGTVSIIGIDNETIFVQYGVLDSIDNDVVTMKLYDLTDTRLSTDTKQSFDKSEIGIKIKYNAVYDVIAREFAGEFESGEIRYGVTSGVMDITDMSAMGDSIPQEIRDKLAAIKEKISSGAIVVERPE